MNLRRAARPRHNELPCPVPEWKLSTFVRQALPSEVVKRISRVSGGLVHHVFHVTCLSGASYFLKIRGSVWSTAASKPIDPRDVAHEAAALRLLSRACPSTFPHLVALDTSAGMILMTDVAPRATTLQQRFERDLVNSATVQRLGYTVACVHRQIAAVHTCIRGRREDEFYTALLESRFRWPNGTPIIGLVHDLQHKPHRLIVGGLSPKNILIRRDGTVAFCDLETVCQGSRLFDVGFCLGHVVLHAGSDPRKQASLMDSFLSGYTELLPLEPATVLRATMLGTMIYRLRRRDIPYAVPFSRTDAARLETQTLSHLLRLYGTRQ